MSAGSMGAMRPFKVANRAQRHDLADVGRLRCRRTGVFEVITNGE
jgi:hypothetical protein